MNAKTKKMLTDNGIGQTHFNQDTADFRRYVKSLGESEALTWLYVIAYLRGKAGQSREDLKKML